MGRTKRPRQSMQVFLDQKNHPINVPVNITNALQHMEDTGQLHYSTAVLADTSVAAPKSHVPGPVNLLPQNKPGASMLVQRAIKAKYGDDAFTPQGALTVVTPEVPLFAPPEKIAKLVHTGTDRSAVAQLRQEAVAQQPPLVLPLPNVPLAYVAPPPQPAQQHVAVPVQPRMAQAVPRPLAPVAYVPRPQVPAWKRALEEAKNAPLTDVKKMKDKVELALKHAEKEEEKYIEEIFAIEALINSKVFRSDNAEALKAAVIGLLKDF